MKHELFMPMVAIAKYQWRPQRGAFDLFSTGRFVCAQTGWMPE
ncbi:MAG: hypothetical protein ABI925_10565 [Verrucomicrobiota bacterium]